MHVEVHMPNVTISVPGVQMAFEPPVEPDVVVYGVKIPASALM